jgi:hypothetical protein
MSKMSKKIFDICAGFVIFTRRKYDPLKKRKQKDSHKPIMGNENIHKKNDNPLHEIKAFLLY